MKYFSSRFYKKLIVLILSFYLCAWFFYWISGSQLRYETIIEKQEEITGSIGELSEGSTATQELLFNLDDVGHPVNFPAELHHIPDLHAAVHTVLSRHAQSCSCNAG